MDWIFRQALTSRGFPTWVRYLFTTGLVLMALALRFAVTSRIEPYRFLPFFPVIIFCGVLLDRGNGIYATLLSTAVIAYFLMPPAGSLALYSGLDLMALLVFATVGLITALLVEALHRAYAELTSANEQLSVTARDRAVLLQELSHRMRNDLSTVSSLLAMQARTLDDPAGRAALGAAADRVKVLARVHQRLSMREGTAMLDTRQFIDELCEDLKVSSIGLRPISLEVQAQSHLITLQRAVALGLVVNELLTNALKHAFPNGRAGRIAVEFGKDGTDLVLCVRDDGVGVQGEAKGTSIGTRLVRSLADSLEGSLDVRPGERGVAVTLRIPADPS